MQSGKTRGRASSWKTDELLVFLMAFFFLFGCLIIPEPPIPVELTTFSDLSTQKTLQFDSPGETEPFQLNISRYTTVGNTSEPSPGNPGVIQLFSMRVCPTEHMGSNVSNLTIYWPSGGSTRFWNDTLTDCQTVYVDPFEFNSYLAVHQAPSMANFITYLIANIIDGGSGISLEWGISQENPKMHDIDEPVTYQLLIVEPSIPDDLIEQIVVASGTGLPSGFDLLLDARLSGLSYTCYDWDQVRETTSPSAIYPIQMAVPGVNISSLINISVPDGTIVMNATVFDLECPAYETPGKYRAQVRRMQFTLENYTGPVPTISFADDFDSPTLNPVWLFRGSTGTELGWYEDNNALSRVDLYSQGNASGSSMYLYRNYTVDESGGALVLEANISTAGEPEFDISSGMPEGAGVLGFMDQAIDPGAYVSEFAPHMRGGLFAFGNNASMVMCQDGTAAYLSATSADFHTYAINVTNDTQTFYLDGAQVAQCFENVSSDLYPLLSSDPATDAFHGDISVNWVNVTTYSGGPGTWSEDWNDFDHFDSTLNESRWLMRNVSFYGAGNATYDYQPALSKISLISEPSTPGGVNTANLLYFNQPLSAPTSNESGVYVVASIYFDEAHKNAAPGLYFSNETIAPTTAAFSEEYQRGGIWYYQDYLIVMCPNILESIAFNLTEATLLMGLPPVTGWHDLGYYSTNDTVVFLYDSIPIPYNCTPHNDTFYVALSSDPLTDAMWGNTSIGRFELYAVEYETEYYGDKWFDIGLLSYMEYLNNSIYSDVLVFDADAEGDFYGRLFDFEVGSDTSGIVQIDELNVTYGSLISYGPAGTSPTTTLDPGNDFSWFAINSHIDNSDLRLNSFAYNSTITDSELILSRADCVNISNSRLLFSGVVYSTEEAYLGDIGGMLGGLETSCAGVVDNSDLEFVFLIGGNAVNSDLRTLPMIISTDFENAVFDNLTLYEGRMIINGTRAPSFFAEGGQLGTVMPMLSSLTTDNSTLIFGCSEVSVLAMDTVADMTIADAPAATLNCRFELHNSNLTLENLTFRNEFGGIRVSLDNASAHISNMPELVNVTTYGQLTDVVIWNLNTSMLSGPLVMSSEGIYVETGMASANDSYPETNLSEVTALFQVSLIFNEVADWDGSVTFYDEFTTNKTEAMENGIECPPERCYYSDFDPVAHTLRVDVSNFSTYVVNYTIWNDTNDTNVTPPGDDHDLYFDVEVEEGCAGEETAFHLSRNNADLEGFSVIVYGPDSQSSLYASLETDSLGIATFVPAEAGRYYYNAHESGYVREEGSFTIEECEAPPQPEQPPEPEPEPAPEPEPGTGGGATSEEQPPAEQPSEEPSQCGEYINGAWVSYECCSDSECGAGSYCIQHMCTVPKPSAEPPVEASATMVGGEGSATAGEKEAAPACCLMGICAELFGLCWYHILALLILLALLAAIAYYVLRAGKEEGEEGKPPSKPKSPK